MPPGFRGRGVENEQKYALKCFNWQLAAGSWQESTDVKPLAACRNATPSTNTTSSATPQGIVVTTTSPTSTAGSKYQPHTRHRHQARPRAELQQCCSTVRQLQDDRDEQGRTHISKGAHGVLCTTLPAEPAIYIYSGVYIFIVRIAITCGVECGLYSRFLM